MAALFQLGDFTLHSGRRSFWRINAEALTDDDLRALAEVVREGLSHFGFEAVIPIPNGGTRFAEALREHANPDGRWTLLVDDVYTTGESMREARRKMGPLASCANFDDSNILGIVIFERGECHEWWIRSLFRMPTYWAGLPTAPGGDR